MAFFEYQDYPQPVKRRGRSVFGWVIMLVTSIAVIALTVLPTPYVIERPGGAYNVLGEDQGTQIISITNATTYETEGALDLLTIQIVGSPKQTPSWLELLFAWLNPAQTILPLDLIYPPEQSQTQVEKENVAMFTNSQTAATAAALKALGYDYETKLIVAGLSENAAAAGKLVEGDQIIEVDGESIIDYEQLTSLIKASEGNELAVSVISKDGSVRVEKITPKLIDDSYRVGAFISPDYKFPINVKLELQDIGGPSGGMMFALGIYDKLTPGALTGGKLVAGTGTINEAGAVGPIGGIRAKMYSARDGGASWFLAPATNCDEVVEHIPSGISVTKVETLEQAIAAVEAIAAGNTASLPTCSTR